ncbi:MULTISPECIES: hypothetical protein [Pectobacterium]|uniref:Uncharacterized protein n=1 Tax=Pectobacterium brasiliense TaxID=180957 RepID=A0A0M2F2N2_9GAMM|nr:hypothetical protein [Pectobacterium brasiliense]KGA34274.1 hypothetical protein KU74_12440 [Pectobacterium brasiliense]
MTDLNRTVTVAHEGHPAVVGISSVIGTAPDRHVRFRVEMRGKTFRQSDFGGHWEQAVFNRKDWYRVQSAMYPTAVKSHFRRVTSTMLRELLDAIIALPAVTSINWVPA